jgi:hypothetical protein
MNKNNDEPAAPSGCCTDYALTPGGLCEGEDAERCMNLPAGKTCGDCFHIYRCRSLGFTSSGDSKTCSFWPRRFLENT